MWLTARDGISRFTPVGTKTVTKQVGTAVAAQGCSTSGTVKVGVKGQEIKFTMKTPIPLAAAQWIFFTKGDGAVVFGNEAVLRQSNADLECGSKKWINIEWKQNSDAEIKVKIPTHQPDGTDTRSTAGDVMCSADDDVVLTIKQWVQLTNSLADMTTANCYACSTEVCSLATAVQGAQTDSIALMATANKFTFQ
jgi:hypothetical protein